MLAFRKQDSSPMTHNKNIPIKQAQVGKKKTQDICKKWSYKKIDL